MTDRPAPEPIGSSTRLVSVDVIRGVALLAIYLVNLQGSFGPARTMIDRGVLWFYAFFIGGSFYPVFCFLFGLGFAVQLERISSRGQAIVPLYLRRLLVLYFLGTAHVILLSFPGDVMREYAVMGVFLLILRHRSPRAILGWAVASLVLTVALQGAAPIRTADAGRAAPSPGAQSNTTSGDDLRTALQHRQYATVVKIRAAQELRRPAILPMNWDSEFPHVLAMFLVGLYAGKRRLLSNVDANRDFLVRAGWWTLAIGVPLKFVWFAWNQGVQDVVGLPRWTNLPLFVFIGGPMLSFFYIASLAVLLSRTRRAAWLHPFAWAGRMPVTIYMAGTAIHFLVITMILGVPRSALARLGPSGGALLKLAIFGGLIVASRFWLRHFRFGPVEWVWRSLTYGRLQPMMNPQQRAVIGTESGA